MHRSGLALAGANTTIDIEAGKRGEAPLIGEDGILTAEVSLPMDALRGFVGPTGSGTGRRR
jgi:hypothetical protein